jgi:hypothetical protein
MNATMTGVIFLCVNYLTHSQWLQYHVTSLLCVIALFGACSLTAGTPSGGVTGIPRALVLGYETCLVSDSSPDHDALSTSHCGHQSHCAQYG